MTILAKDCHVKFERESVYLHGQHVTEFLTNSCMFAYNVWQCAHVSFWWLECVNNYFGKYMLWPFVTLMWQNDSSIHVAIRMTCDVSILIGHTKLFSYFWCYKVPQKMTRPPRFWKTKNSKMHHRGWGLGTRPWNTCTRRLESGPEDQGPKDSRTQGLKDWGPKDQGTHARTRNLNI